MDFSLHHRILGFKVYFSFQCIGTAFRQLWKTPVSKGRGERKWQKHFFFFCMSSSQVRTLKLVLDTLLTMKTAVFSRHPVVQHHWKPMLPSKLSVRTRPINYSSLSLDLYMIGESAGTIWAWFMLEVLYAKSGKMDAMVMMEPCWLQVKSMILPRK